ncbi:hypothetical protein GB937_006180 [Aspergillus fischeri]|nr:hypothetical protein GB937_006180 [Aspergillus fischeri]
MAITIPNCEGAIAVAQREVPFALNKIQQRLASRNDVDVTKEIIPKPISSKAEAEAEVELLPRKPMKSRKPMSMGFDKWTTSTKRRRNPLDGAVLPWPVAMIDFEDLDRLRLIRSDLSRFEKVVGSLPQIQRQVDGFTFKS